MKLAPIALITYNRSNTLLKTINSLKKNKLIKKTDLYIFSDGPKNNIIDKKKVKKVRDIIKNLKNINIKKIILHKKNIGVKKNIISSVNYVLKKNSKIIVIEDDLILSPAFLNFMNTSLDYIKSSNKIWHVSGWNYPISENQKYKADFFLWSNMNCWGWGTHKKYWKKLILDEDFFIKNFSNDDIKKFDMHGKLKNWVQLKKNKQKIIKTWAIFWNATIFWNKGLCLNPVLSYTKNIGFDENSTHTKKKYHNYLN